MVSVKEIKKSTSVRLLWPNLSHNQSLAQLFLNFIPADSSCNPFFNVKGRIKFDGNQLSLSCPTTNATPSTTASHCFTMNCIFPFEPKLEAKLLQIISTEKAHVHRRCIYWYTNWSPCWLFPYIHPCTYFPNIVCKSRGKNRQEISMFLVVEKARVSHHFSLLDIFSFSSSPTKPDDWFQSSVNRKQAHDGYLVIRLVVHERSLTPLCCFCLAAYLLLRRLGLYQLQPFVFRPVLGWTSTSAVVLRLLSHSLVFSIEKQSLSLRLSPRIIRYLSYAAFRHHHNSHTHFLRRSNAIT